MANPVINHQELLQKIQFPSGKGILLSEQSSIPAPATRAMLRAAQRVNGIFDRQDQLELSEQCIKALHYMAEHDYLAYLTITHRFDLIRKIFWDKDLFAQQLAMIEEIEKENAKKQYQDELIVAQESLANRLKQQNARKGNEEQRKNEEQHFIVFDLFEYYHLIEQGIIQDFHQKQIEVYTQTYKDQVARIKKSIEVIKYDDSISYNDKIEFQKLLDRYQQHWSRIVKINTNNADGSVNTKELERKYTESKALYEEVKTDFSNLLNKYPNNAHLQQIAREQDLANKQFDGKLAENESIRDRRLAEIRPHLESTREAAKEEVSKSMVNSINYLSECHIEFINGSVQDRFQNSLSTLTQLNTEINRSQEPNQITELSKRFLQEITLIQEIVPPEAFQKGNYQKFIDETNKIGTLTSHKIGDFPPSYEVAIKEDHSSPNEAAIQEDQPSPPNYEAKSEEPPPAYEENKVQVESPPLTAAMMRNTLFSQRAGVEEPKVVDEKSSKGMEVGGEIVELDDEKQQVIEETLNDLSLSIDDAIKNAGLNLKEQLLELKQLRTEINPFQGKVNLTKSQLLCERLEKLNNSLFDEPLEKLKEFTSSLSNGPTLGI